MNHLQVRQLRVKISKEEYNYWVAKYVYTRISMFDDEPMIISTQGVPIELSNIDSRPIIQNHITGK